MKRLPILPTDVLITDLPTFLRGMSRVPAVYCDRSD